MRALGRLKCHFSGVGSFPTFSTVLDAQRLGEVMGWGGVADLPEKAERNRGATAPQHRDRHLVQPNKETSARGLGAKLENSKKQNGFQEKVKS